MGLSLSLLQSAWQQILSQNFFDLACNNISLASQDSSETTTIDYKIRRKKLKALSFSKISFVSNGSDGSIHDNSPRSVGELDAAAVKLQKVYKSYRTRRNLADCAVVVEELWWKVLDLAELKQKTASFFEVDKPESAVSRWVRAKTKAAKVGKGLSKDEKAKKLALQHWLEAIDPRHRYGHNLHMYYEVWFSSESAQPFFY